MALSSAENVGPASFSTSATSPAVSAVRILRITDRTLVRFMRFIASRAAVWRIFFNTDFVFFLCFTAVPPGIQRSLMVSLEFSRISDPRTPVNFAATPTSALIWHTLSRMQSQFPVFPSFSPLAVPSFGPLANIKRAEGPLALPFCMCLGSRNAAPYLSTWKHVPFVSLLRRQPAQENVVIIRTFPHFSRGRHRPKVPRSERGFHLQVRVFGASLVCNDDVVGCAVLNRG